MRTEEDVSVVKAAEVLRLDDLQPLGAEAVDLLPVVDDVTDTVDLLAAVEARLKSGDSSADTEAKT